MRWQEYERAVSSLYERLATDGVVSRNVRRPDLDTGSPRQVDVWWEISLAGHVIYVLIDAKFRTGKVDVKDVEEVSSLARAVGAHKCVIVAAHGWTEAAAEKARRGGIDLRLFTVEEALRILNVAFWILCPACRNDCIILDQGGLPVSFNGRDIFGLGGACRECGAAAAQCGTCHSRRILPADGRATCRCGHIWSNVAGRIFFSLDESDPVGIALDKLAPLEQA